MAKVDLSGKVFGHLKVIEWGDRTPQGTRWRCRCACGQVRLVRATRLRRGETHSCGRCSKIEHGYSRNVTKEYIAWKAMNQRCRAKEGRNFEAYGKRGITVCREWQDSFPAFLRDVGVAPSPEHSLDRENNDKGYSKGNVRWATDVQQANNRRPRRRE